LQNITLKIEAIKQETKDTLTLCFKQPGLRKIKYQAGQYLTLSFRIDGRKYTRAYSFSSSPSIDSFLEVTIKRIPNGIVSNYIHTFLQVGDMVEAIPPMGDFVFDSNSQTKTIYFWGAGSGITPLMAMIKEILFFNQTIQLNLIYGNKNLESVIFLDKIKELESLYPKQFKVFHFLSQEKNISQKNIFEGRINTDFIETLLKDNDSQDTLHYICGSDGLKKTIKTVLNQMQFPESAIYSEDFELIIDPSAFEGIQDRLVKINFLEKEAKIEVLKGKNVLEAALDNNIELPYSCQTGSCSTCKATLITGKMKMIGLEKPRTDLNQNEFLLCCSYPLTEDIYIKV
jgi:ring-1,2-phenylacetyl-CoA epoxidase subunit PaaE